MMILTRNYPNFCGLTRPNPTRKNWALGLTRPGPTRGGAQLPDPTRGSRFSDPQHPYNLPYFTIFLVNLKLSLNKI